MYLRSLEADRSGVGERNSDLTSTIPLAQHRSERFVGARAAATKIDSHNAKNNGKHSVTCGESRLLPGGRQYTWDCEIQPEVLNALAGAPTRHRFLRTPTVTSSGRIYRGTSPRRVSRNLPCSKLPAPSCAEE